MNLLRNIFIGRLFGFKWFPLVIQLFTLLAFVLLISGGLGVSATNPDFIYRLRYTNLSNLIVWTLWWPMIIIAAVFIGRFWCTICPMELITYLASCVGFKKQVPGFLKTGWAVTIFYATIWIVGVQILAINRVPHQMALYMLFLIIAAIDISLIFQKRAFCSYFCPIGHLLGLYSLISPFEWRADNLETCKSCKTKDCITRKNNYKLAARSCTSNLYPATIEDNRDCLLCTQCLKACPTNNIKFSSRKPYSDFFKDINLRPAQVGFIMLLGAFVVYEILSEWTVSFDILMWLPIQIIDNLKISGPMANLVWTSIMFLVVPLVASLVIDILTMLLSGRKQEDTRSVLSTFALLLLPTIAAAHIIKSILKMSSHVPYWKYAISDPKGLKAAQGIMSGKIVLDNSIVTAMDSSISVIIISILILALAATMWIFCQSKIVQKHNSGTKFVLLLGVLSYWTIFGLTIFNWRLG